MTPSRLFISVLLLMVVGISAHAKTVYVDDTFYAPIRSGEGTQFRILHQGLRSGTPIELLEQKESGYSRIRTRDGIEGYILTRYLSNTPIARDRLEAANKDLERARSELAEVRQQLQTVTQERSNLASSEQNLEQRSSQLAAELARVKEVSANALSLERRNDELQEENQKLRNDPRHSSAGELPWYWQGFDMAWFAFLMVLLAPGLLALVFGFLAFRSRVTGVYLSIITQALTFALMLAFFRNEMGFGGNNGLTDFKDILGFSLRSDATRLGLFIATGIALAIGYVICRGIVTSKLGRVSIACRDAEARTRFLGYRVDRVQLFVFVVSAMLAGVAGALYVPQVGIINPGEFSPLFSIEIVVWVALGGRATLYGAVIGALLVNYAKTVFTGVMPDAWLFALGGLFVLVTVFLPKGIAGLLQRRSAPPASSTSQEAAA